MRKAGLQADITKRVKAIQKELDAIQKLVKKIKE